jgi:hypothetical protein
LIEGEVAVQIGGNRFGIKKINKGRKSELQEGKKSHENREFKEGMTTRLQSADNEVSAGDAKEPDQAELFLEFEMSGSG